MIAVLSVVLAHSGVSSFFSARHGVAGFFVLSGFLITWLLLKERENTGTISLRNFYVRRSLRIFPAYYIFLLVSISWDLYRNNPGIEEVILPGLFYVINYHNALEGHSQSSLGHLWSLAVEEQFYLLWPFIFILLMKKGANFAVGFLVCSCVVVLCWRTYGYTWLNLGTSYAYNAFDTRFDNLAIGCLMAFLLKRDWAIMVADWLGDRFWKPIVTIVLLAVSKDVPNQDYLYGPGFTIDALLLAILLIQFMRLGYGAVWGWLNYRFVVYLGVISYPIYLWHVWGVQAGHKLTFLPEFLQNVAGIIFSCLLAALSYHVIERKFLALKNRFQVIPNSHKPLSGRETVASSSANSSSATKVGQK